MKCKGFIDVENGTNEFKSSTLIVVRKARLIAERPG